MDNESKNKGRSELADHVVENWLVNEVAGVYDAMEKDPGRAISSEQVFATLRARHADRLRQKPRDL